MPRPVEPPPPPKDLASNEDLYLAGLRLEQFHSPAAEPEPYYQEALRRDAGDVRANTALGVLYCTRGMFEQAQERLRAVVDRLTRNYTRPRDGEALYYLGVALKAQGKTAEARDWLQRAAWSVAWRAASLQVLAEMACREGDWPGALELIDQSLACNALNTRALNVKTVVLRKSGRLDQALALTAATLQIDPLDRWALNERRLSLVHPEQYGASRQQRHEPASPMHDAETWLELACDYEACGLWDEAIAVLRRLADSHGADSKDPVVHYALGYCHERAGQAQLAREQYRLAAEVPADRCFLFRIESAAWLRAAIARNPADSRAHYYLGDLLYDLQPTEAVRVWERSRELDDTFWLAHRNLGFAYARLDPDRRRAIASLQEGDRMQPSPTAAVPRTRPSSRGRRGLRR